jgi:alcohol oxidase
LHLVVNTKCEKVILEGDRAVGVKVCPTKPLSPGQQQSRVYKARKQIIVSGGTLSSPLILQRSGIGNPEKLRKAGVKPLIDLPGVGLNFQDHYLTFATYRAKPHVESFDDFVRGDKETQEKVFNQWNINGTGPLATNGIDAGVKIRPTEEELKQMDSWPCPEFRSGWDSYFKDKPDKPVMHYSVIAGWFGDHMLMPPGKVSRICPLLIGMLLTRCSSSRCSTSSSIRSAVEALSSPAHRATIHLTSMLAS